MANNPISMIKIRQILRLQSQGCSKLQIAAQTGIARNTLKKYITEFISSGLTFDEINELSDKELEDLFVKPEDKPLNERLQILFSLFPAIDKELKKKGVTRQLLWEEYKRHHPDGVGKSQFKHYFSQWKAQVNPTMHMEHKAGDKLYVDLVSLISKQAKSNL
jgi:transposase